MQKWLVFDAMGVVYETGDDTRELLIPYIQARNEAIDAKALEELYLQVSLGSITPEAFWIAAGFQNANKVQTDYLDTCLTLNPAFPGAAKRLSKRYSIAMLSNDIDEWSIQLRRRFGIESLFRYALISSTVHVRKPDLKIYEILLSTIGADPKDCIFVDDLARNLHPARALGMRAVLFNRLGADNEGFECVSSFTELEELLQK